MTTEIEKKFFNIFEIKPIGCNDNENCTGTLDCTQCPNAKYPQITDRQYLELICIINRFDIHFDYYYQEEYQVLRETILEDSINLNCKLKQTDFSELKHQVQAIFKEQQNDR